VVNNKTKFRKRSDYLCPLKERKRWHHTFHGKNCTMARTA